MTRRSSNNLSYSASHAPQPWDTPCLRLGKQYKKVTKSGKSPKFKGIVSPQENFGYVVKGCQVIPKTSVKILKEFF